MCCRVLGARALRRPSTRCGTTCSRRGTRQPAFRVVRAGATVAQARRHPPRRDRQPRPRRRDRPQPGGRPLPPRRHGRAPGPPPHRPASWPSWPTTSHSPWTTPCRSTPTSRRQTSRGSTCTSTTTTCSSCSSAGPSAGGSGIRCPHGQPGQGPVTRSPSRASTSSAIRCSTSRSRQATACICHAGSRTRPRPSTRLPTTSRSASSR